MVTDLQNTVIKEFQDHPGIEIAVFNQGGRFGEDQTWLETFWENHYLRGSVIHDSAGTVGMAYHQISPGLPFARGYIIGPDGKVIFPYFGHYPQKIISMVYSIIDSLGIEYYPFLPGDVNMSAGVWPPSAIGSDVTYLVNYFRGLETSQPCLLNGLWASADANGDCNIIGSDVTKMVNYLRGLAVLQWCPSHAPYWFSTDDLPEVAPDGWPGCE